MTESVSNFINSLPKAKNGFCPFDEKIHRQLAFGKIPARRKYELRTERYRSGAEIIRGLLFERDKDKEKLALDVGSGEGSYKFFLDDPNITWHGIEILENKFQFCEALGYKMVKVNLDTEPLPYPNGMFDVVIASHVIEHLSNSKQCLGELNRVLKPGGILLVATPTKPPFIAWLLHRLHKMQEKKTGQTQNSFSVKSLQAFILNTLGWPSSSIKDVRGVRIFSAKKHLPLEDWKWFYQLSLAISKKAFWIVPEVNVILKKPE